MEPIGRGTINTVQRHTTPKQISAEPTVKAVNNKSVRPEFVSPKGKIDAESGVYVVQFRNSSTGNVNFQYPNKKVVAEYARSDNLISASESKSKATTAVNNVGAAPSQVASSPSATSSEQTSSTAGPVNAAPLGTTVND
jgi:hypothetical protein